MKNLVFLFIFVNKEEDSMTWRLMILLVVVWTVVQSLQINEHINFFLGRVSAWSAIVVFNWARPQFVPPFGHIQLPLSLSGKGLLVVFLAGFLSLCVLRFLSIYLETIIWALMCWYWIWVWCFYIGVWTRNCISIWANQFGLQQTGHPPDLVVRFKKSKNCQKHLLVSITLPNYVLLMVRTEKSRKD